MILPTTDGKIGRGRPPENRRRHSEAWNLAEPVHYIFQMFWHCFASFHFAKILATKFLLLYLVLTRKSGSKKPYLQQLNIHGRLRGRRSLEVAVLSWPRPYAQEAVVTFGSCDEPCNKIYVNLKSSVNRTYAIWIHLYLCRARDSNLV